MPVGQALTTTTLGRRSAAAGVAAGGTAGAVAGAAGAPAGVPAVAPAGAAAGAGGTTSSTSRTTSSAEDAQRSDATNSGRTRARARAVSRVRWSASPCAGAAMRKARSAGPSGAPKSTFGDSRANAREAAVTAAERQCGIAMPPGRPVAACDSRAIASAARASVPVARPASATRPASRWTTAALSPPRSASRATSSVVISGDMADLPGGLGGESLADVAAGGRDGGAGSGGAPGDGGRRAGGDGHAVGVDLGRGGHGGAGQRGARRAVGDGGAQPVGRERPGQVGEHVAGQAAVARADGAADGDRRRRGRPQPLGGREQRAVGAEREQDRADAAPVQCEDGG